VAGFRLEGNRVVYVLYLVSYGSYHLQTSTTDCLADAQENKRKCVNMKLRTL